MGTGAARRLEPQQALHPAPTHPAAPACVPAPLPAQICCSFGVDVLEALAASCTQLAAAWSRRAAFNVACDAAVACLLLVLHGAALMSQARNWVGCRLLLL